MAYRRHVGGSSKKIDGARVRAFLDLIELVWPRLRFLISGFWPDECNHYILRLTPFPVASHLQEAGLTNTSSATDRQAFRVHTQTKYRGAHFWRKLEGVPTATKSPVVFSLMAFLFNALANHSRTAWFVSKSFVVEVMSHEWYLEVECTPQKIKNFRIHVGAVSMTQCHRTYICRGETTSQIELCKCASPEISDDGSWCRFCLFVIHTYKIIWADLAPIWRHEFVKPVAVVWRCRMHLRVLFQTRPLCIHTARTFCMGRLPSIGGTRHWVEDRFVRTGVLPWITWTS